MATITPTGGDVTQGAAVSVQRYTFSNSYTAGGETLTEPRLRRITGAVCSVLVPGASIAHVTYDRTTSKAKAFTAAAEVTAATDLSSVQFEVAFYGVL